MKSLFPRIVCWSLLSAALAWAVLAVFDLGGQRRLFHAEGAELLSDYNTPRACASATDPYHPCTVKDVDACYPALAYAIVRIFPENVSGGIALTLLMSVIYLCSLAAILKEKGQPTSALKAWPNALPVVACAVSAPMLFTMERGNLVILAASGVAFFCAYYDSASKSLRIAAAFALALAVALKIVPIIFAILMFLPSDKEKRARRIGACALMSVPCSLFLFPF